jgi:formate dehydrogenase alpha subunit
MERIALTIDGRELSAKPGATLLEAAEAGGIRIPHLCHEPRLKPSGACRLCLVEIAGQPGFHAACARPAQRGMVVSTASEAVRNMRLALSQLILDGIPTTVPVLREILGHVKFLGGAYDTSFVTNELGL